MVSNKVSIMGILLSVIIILSGCQQVVLPETHVDFEGVSSFNPFDNIETSDFKSLEELRGFIKQYGASYSSFGGRGLMVEEAVMAMDSGAVKTQSAPMVGGLDYSETNVQVEGVDEGDILKTDGNYIYTITGKTLFIIKAYPGEDAEVVHKMKVENNPRGLFINGDKMILFGDVSEIARFEKVNLNTMSGLSFFEIYDVSDKENPLLLKEYEFEGRYAQSRMVGDFVYYVVSSMPDYRRSVPMPMIIEDGVSRNMAVMDVHYFPIPYDSTVFTTVHAVDLNAEKVNSKTLVVESNQNMYMSNDNIYLTYTKYVNEWDIRQDITIDIIEPMLVDSDKAFIAKIRNADDDLLSKYEKKSKIMDVINSHINYLDSDEREDLYDLIEKKLKEELKKYESREYTVIHKVAVQNGYIDVHANGRVPGYINNQFSMDEFEGVLRIATTVSSNWNTFEDEVGVMEGDMEIAVPSIFMSAPSIMPRQRSQSTNHVFTLDSELEVMDRLDDLGKGESIFSTRFMGEKLYMVTFRQVDPFFVIDLGNPNDIKELGELKIPGFSRYLHPYDEDVIIGLGRDATDEGRTKGLKISLFDVSDVSNPKEIAKYVSDDRYASSTAEYEHKAFLFSKEKGLLVIPAYSYDWEDNDGYNGALVFDIDKTGIELRGLVDHSSERYGPSVERSLYIEDLLYTKSPSLLRINKLDDLSSVKDVKLEAKYAGDIPVF